MSDQQQGGTMGMRRLLRLVGVAQGDPYDPHTVSGVPRHLLDALDRDDRYGVVGRVDAALRPWQYYGVAAATFHPSRPRCRK